MGRTVESKDFHASLLAVKGDLARRKVTLDEKHYIIVPDKCSIFAERFLFGGGDCAGAFDAEVLTFGRFYHKFRRPGVSFLPKAGAVMLLKKIIGAVKKDFKVFKTAAQFPGLAEKMYEAVGTAVAAGLSPEDLRGAAGASGLKLADIALVYEEYLKETKNKFVDTFGRTCLLKEALAEADLSRAHFYIACFDRFTKPESGVLELLERRAFSYTRYDAAAPGYWFGETEFYEAAEIFDRIKAAAKRIRAGAVGGARYRDFCILASPAAYAPLARILTEFDIPFYIDKKIKLSETELFRFLELSADLARSYRRADFIRLSKNFYAGIEKTDSDIFENYVTAAAVDYKRFSEPFLIDGEESAAAESVRARLTAYIQLFGNALRGADTPEKFFRFLQKAFVLCGAAEKTQKLSATAGTDLNQVYEKLLSAAELLNMAAPASAPPATYFTLFSEGAAAVELSLLSGTDDAVTVGGAETFRAGKFKEVFAVEFCDGLVPERFESGGLVGDAERSALCGTKLAFFPSASELNRYAADEVIRLFNLAEKLFLAYPSMSEISHLAGTVERNSKKVTRWSLAADRLKIYDEAAFEAAVSGRDGAYFADFARAVSTKGNALEMLILSAAESASNKPGLPSASVLRAVAADKEVNRYLNVLAREEILPAAGRLFFRGGTVSVSRLQEYFDCPYKSFLSSGLGLCERETGELTPVDAGNFLHRAAELFVRSGDFENPAGSMERIALRIAETEYPLLKEKNAPLLARLTGEAVSLADGIAATFLSGSFRNLGVEMRFGHAGNNDLKTVSFSRGGEGVSLRGTIDRVDVYDGYARVIDYKTGKAPEFSFRELYYGRRVQLAVYLKILEENGYRPAGMFYFPLSARWDDAQSARRFFGVFNDAEELISAADRALSGPGAKSAVIPAERNKTAENGRFPLRQSPWKCGEDELRAFSGYAVSVLEGALDEIADGYIAAAPNASACAYCPYGAVCGFDPGGGKIRVYEKITGADIVAAAGNGEAERG